MTDSGVTTSNAEAGAGTHRAPLKLLAAAAALVALILLARQTGQYIPQFAARVEDLGIWGPLVFIAGYGVAVIAVIPGSLLTLAGGAIFGLFEGTVYVFVAALLGSAGAFLVARYAARGFVERRVQDQRAFHRHRPRRRRPGPQDRLPVAALAGLPFQPPELRARSQPSELPRLPLRLARNDSGHAALRVLRQARRRRGRPRWRRRGGEGYAVLRDADCPDLWRRSW